jgi:hypothetical protein
VYDDRNGSGAGRGTRTGLERDEVHEPRACGAGDSSGSSGPSATPGFASSSGWERSQD